MAERQGLRPDYLLAQNIRALLRERGQTGKDLAAWCGHEKPWISKILACDRGVQLDDLGKIADFFGLTIAELFQHGIDPLTERRQRQRRTNPDRRSGSDRRQPHDPGRLHARTTPRFRSRHRSVPMAKPAVFLLLIVLSACGGPSSPSNTVTYRVSGVSTASLITYEMESGTAQRSNVPLPWTQSRPGRSGDFLYVSAQNGGSSGCINVAISKGRETIASNQSCGAFVIATASATH